MRMLLDGLEIDTAAYIEDSSISFTVFTYGQCDYEALSQTLASPERVLDLRRGDERLCVRVSEHQCWPPNARRFGDAMQRHDIMLETVDHAHPAAKVALPSHLAL